MTAWANNWVCSKNVPAHIKPCFKVAEVTALLKAENDKYDDWHHRIVYEYENKEAGYKAKVGIQLELTSEYTKRGRKWVITQMYALSENGATLYNHDLVS